MTPLHDWNLAPKEARILQQTLAARVDTSFQPIAPRTIGAIDVSSEWHGSELTAGVVVCDAKTLAPIDRAWAYGRVSFPYVPGLLSFRELPLVLEAYERLTIKPDLVLCDGQGIAHPRRLGIASHLGLWLDAPTIGCAKTRLIGEYSEPGPNRGDWTPLVDHGETIGAAVRTRSKCKPVYVSIGHKINLQSSIDITMACTARYRLPIPARSVHEYVNRVRRSLQADSAFQG